MKELSIFIDESGDFGNYDFHSPYYILSLVFHNQNNDIEAQISHLNQKLSYYNIEDKSIHTAPLVRGEENYQNLDVHDRRKILLSFISFVKWCDIQYKCFVVNKKETINSMNLTTKLSKLLSTFLKENLELFNQYDSIKIYYDNGQHEVTKIVNSIFTTLFNDPIIKKVKPSDYKLFQAADLFCYFMLLSLKDKSKCLSMSEKRFFENSYNLHRMYIKQFHRLEFSSSK